MSKPALFIILEDYDDTYDSEDEDYENDLSGENFIEYISRQYAEHEYIDNETACVKIEENDILEEMKANTK